MGEESVPSTTTVSLRHENKKSTEAIPYLQPSRWPLASGRHPRHPGTQSSAARASWARDHVCSECCSSAEEEKRPRRCLMPQAKTGRRGGSRRPSRQAVLPPGESTVGWPTASCAAGAALETTLRNDVLSLCPRFMMEMKMMIIQDASRDDHKIFMQCVRLVEKNEGEGTWNFRGA